MSWKLLERFLESDHFNNDPSLTVAYLSRYADQIGIHYVLCTKLRKFSYEEIEFFLPQLCHLLISIDNESMALEEFIIDLCEESVNGALLSFWLFQTYLHDLASNPFTNAFRTCRRIYNKIQRIVFGGLDALKRERIRENILPVTVLASIVLAAPAAPFFPAHAGPLAVAQARKPQPADTISDATQGQRLVRSNTVAAGAAARPPNAAARQRRNRQIGSINNIPQSTDITNSIVKSPSKSPAAISPAPTIHETLASPEKAPKSLAVLVPPPLMEARLSSSSLPDFREEAEVGGHTPPRSAALPAEEPGDRPRKTSRHKRSESRPLSPSSLTKPQRRRILRSNYFRCETQFLSALEDISNRLVIVPKAARLSALRAELALIARDLPAEVDIPLICPSSLEDGVPSLSKHHRIVRLNPAEATSLNSAERVPYLLMVEILREDFDFDPDSESNTRLLRQLVLDKGASRKRLFDLTDAARESLTGEYVETPVELTPTAGDLTNPGVLWDTPDGDIGKQTAPSAPDLEKVAAKPPLPTEGALAAAIRPANSRQSSVPGSRSNTPRPHRSSTPSAGNAAQDPSDIAALASHMRTAAQMLAQLDMSGAKRPKHEVAAIKEKIIASMQSLEEKGFDINDKAKTQNFDNILSDMDTLEPSQAAEAGVPSDADPETSAEKGAARMENDAKIGGVQRQGDRDDPSAATFGEEWTEKKERIRLSSPYGSMPNWDLVSVIVKTGADLRQEAFACQLIQICSNIWRDAEVPVYVRNMRILVTGESSGLIETVTDAVSLHSLKRSLTLSTIAAGTNPRRRIATLREHFLKTYGDETTATFKAAVDAFCRSLAAYSIISYVLQLKDRHNGNLLIDQAGHIVHIDFGFMLSNSPGSMGFEAAPFKLTYEYAEVLGGSESEMYQQYKQLCKASFQALRRNAETIVMLVEVMGRESRMPCFSGGLVQVIASLRQRFHLELSEKDAETFVENDLIGKSLGSYYTKLYDTFQYRTQGIY